MEREHSKRLAVRLAADPAGVPAARRFVVDGLAAGTHEALADAAELVISELAGNAALHGGARFMYVAMEHRVRGVRVSVEDDGPVGAEAVRPPLLVTGEPEDPEDVDDLQGWAAQATTGRGLALVSMVSGDWGVAATPRGKLVWADVVEPAAENDVRPPSRQDAEDSVAPPAELPPGWALVRLARCPVRLSLRQDNHLDELVRELQLIGAGSNESARAVAAEISELLMSPAHARLTGRRAAEQALLDGLEHVDIDMAMPREFSVLIRRLHAAVARADVLCERDELLSLASDSELRALREWMTQEVVAQVEQGAPPVPWPDWVASRAGTC
ncbi:hypothetical protein DDE18_06375 [Nocardioides gansuensis]|uniref:Histidine kinase/HSP90-like ATPase domain-containing protein n=1 Tax=Nocardioides gansuensis TaxID=2138300 RepID=A0A2T8FDX6_9ACTN|nr:ATP-binding protein [Nocardioides gansuensis]PVG83912.1 hypothetical protein DDE18_06375 [Nocardioides gansuensis]